jgi:hypothetical protein
MNSKILLLNVPRSLAAIAAKPPALLLPHERAAGLTPGKVESVRRTPYQAFGNGRTSRRGIIQVRTRQMDGFHLAAPPQGFQGLSV